MTDRERFFELLPFHVNGTLAAADRDWMLAELAREPALQAQVALQQALRDEMRSAAEASLAGVPADVGYARIAPRLRARAPALATPWQPVTTPWQRLRDWFSLPAPRGWRLAQGLAFGLVVGMGVMLAVNNGRDEAPIMRGATPGRADGPLLRVSFRPEASERNLRLALIEARALIVAGPTRLGDYYLKTAPGRLDEAREALLRSGVAQSADEVPGLPQELTE